MSRDDARALALVARHGRIGTAFQVLSPGMAHWFDGDGATTRGMVAYADTGRAWVAAGEPVAAPADAIAVAERFVAAAGRVGRRASFFGTEGILASSPNFRRFLLGEQPVWDPQLWPSHVASHRSLREQIRRARAKGVTVRALSASEVDAPAMQSQLQALVQHWLAARPMPPMHFLVEVAPLTWLAHRRLFVAERGDPARGDTVVGLLSLAPVSTRGGWLFEHLLRDPSAPNGTAERMVDTAMRALADDGVEWATLGLAPLSGTLPAWLRLIRSASRPLYNFDGLAAFKRKLRPQHWEPMYLAYPSAGLAASSPALASARALLDGLRAFADGPLWRFAMKAVLRGPPPLLRALEALLIPWTLLLGLAPTTPWFPSTAVHVAWVVFDVALFAMLRLVRGRAGANSVSASRASASRASARVDTVWLMRVLAGAVTLDAMLTSVQAAWWNIPRIATWWDGMLIAIACAGPLLTAPTLWGASRRMARLREAPAAR